MPQRRIPDKFRVPEETKDKRDRKLCSEANLNRHALRPNKNIGIFDPTFIIEMRTKGISITP